MSHPPKAGHTRVTIDLAPGQTVAQALGLGAASDGKAEAYVRDLAAAVRELDLPKLPKEGPRWLEWLRDVATHSRVEVDEEGRSSLRKPEGGAEFWRTGLREAALELTGTHMNVVTPKGFANGIYQLGLMDGEAKKMACFGLAAQGATGCGDAITKPEDPTAFVAWLISYGEGQAGEASTYSEKCEAEAFERGRVAGLRAAVQIQPRRNGWVVRSPDSAGFGSRTLAGSAWEFVTADLFETKDKARAAADAAPNWWEAGQ